MSGSPAGSDPVDDLVESLLKAAGIVVLVLLALPLVVPVLAVRAAGLVVATRARFWIARSWLTLAALLGPAVVVAMLTVEAALVTSWVRHAEAVGSVSVWRALPALWSVGWPFLIANLLSGVLLLPAAFVLRRRRIAGLLHARRISNVVLQERIDSARIRAAAWSASHRMGVRVDVQTGRILSTDGAMAAPYPVGNRWAFGLTATPTVQIFRDRFRDTRRVRDWIDPATEAVLLPAEASAARALVVAESGTGKTVLLNGLVACALAARWPVFVIDAKGDPRDADEVVAQARAAGRSAAVGARWNLFSGSAEQVTEKLMRLLPPADGANQHYLDEARGVLGMIQSHAPIQSVPDLWRRLGNPAPHLRDDADLHAVEAIVEPRSGLTAAGRVMQALAPALRPLEEWIDVTGWSYAHPNADVTVMSLSPVDVTQARLGNLLMVDLRHFLASRLRAGDKSPVLVIVDEFPQLVTAESDPGDAAAALLETARSAGAGLILAAQSTAGISNDEARRARALASGAALIIGRSKDPDLIVNYAGTNVRLESTGIIQEDGLVGGRAQHAFVIPPQEVREAWDGSFWLVQGGGVAPFRTMPPRGPGPVAHAASLLIPDSAPSPDPALPGSLENPNREPEIAMRKPARPMTRKSPAPQFSTRFEPTPAPRETAARTLELKENGQRESEQVTGLEIVVAPATIGRWEAVAYAATDLLVLDDLESERVVLPTPRTGRVPEAAWAADWQPGQVAPWHDGQHSIPEAWVPLLEDFLGAARTRYGI